MKLLWSSLKQTCFLRWLLHSQARLISVIWDFSCFEAPNVWSKSYKYLLLFFSSRLKPVFCFFKLRGLARRLIHSLMSEPVFNNLLWSYQLPLVHVESYIILGTFPVELLTYNLNCNHKSYVALFYMKIV